MPDDNPKLAVNILSEVVFEARFKPVGDFPLVVGRLYETLKNDYPQYENLNAHDFPIDIPELGNIVSYRCKSADGKKLYSLGRGLISINTLEYDRFSMFLADVKKVINAHKAFTKVSEITRAGLRYINKIDAKDKNFEDITVFKFELPKNFINGQQGFKYMTDQSLDGDVLSTKVSYYPFSSNTIVIDFDLFSKLPKPYDNSIDNWIRNGHDQIYQSFKRSLTDEYFAGIS